MQQWGHARHEQDRGLFIPSFAGLHLPAWPDASGLSQRKQLVVGRQQPLVHGAARLAYALT